MVDSFPVSSFRDLALGQQGGGTLAPGLSQGFGLVAMDAGGAVPSDALDAAVWLFCSSDPTALTGQTPGSLVFGIGANAGSVYVVNDAGAPVEFLDNGALTGTLVVDSIDLGDNDPLNFGDADDIVMKWTGSVFTITQATANSAIQVGVSGAGIDLQLYGDTAGRDLLWDQSADALKAADNTAIIFGTGLDLSVTHNGTNSLITSTTGNLLIDSQAATGAVYVTLGTDTNATEFAVRNNSESRIFRVEGDGAVSATGTITAGGLTSAGTVQISDGGLLLQVGSGTGTGDKIAVLGVDATHGIATYVYEATVSPAAVETALFTVPVMSVIDCVQANVESALTGGGTTVTFSIGITGDVDAYGTASNSGVQADLLTKNAKINAIGNVAADAGASLGVWSAATVALKLIAAATGGTAAGDTALTVGSVKVRVVYRSLLALADAP